MEENRKKILTEAVNLWGKESQIMMTIEEMAELTQALSKYKRHRDKAIANVLEELADVRIMIDQLVIIFDDGPLEAHEFVKLARLEKIIANYKDARR